MSVSASTGLDAIRWQAEEKITEGTDNAKKQMTQQDFFALLTTQLAAQDPTKPTDNDQMIAQMTNFTMADGISNLSTQFDTFSDDFGSFMNSMQSQQTSNKALQASSMVGREVLVPAEDGALFQYGEDVFGLRGQLQTESSVNDIRLEVRDQSGKIINNVELGASSSGPFDFMWDGKDVDGNQMPPGIYNISATGIDANTGQRTALPTATYSTVDSVRFGNGNELTMNLRGLGSFTMDEIIEVAP